MSVEQLAKQAALGWVLSNTDGIDPDFFAQELEQAEGDLSAMDLGYLVWEPFEFYSCEGLLGIYDDLVTMLVDFHKEATEAA